MNLTDDMRGALYVVATLGNRTMKSDPTLRYGASARSVAARNEWRTTLRNGTRRPATQAAVKRLLALRTRRLVTDVDGRWYTTDEGEALARELWPNEVEA